MSPDDFKREIVFALHSGEISPILQREFLIAIGLRHPLGDLHRYVAKLLHRHRKKPGRKADSNRKKLIAKAAHMARFNRAIGKEAAARVAAEEFGVRFNEVFEAAFLYKRGPMRALMRKTRLTPQELKGGSQDKNSVVDRHIRSTPE